MDELEKKLKEALELQSKIEEKMKFIEENSDNLSDKQLEDLANMVINIEQSLFPEVDKIKQEMEENKQAIINKGTSNQNNDDLSS